jgi:Zn-dependent peptidase ImmA (M78 family)
MVDTQRTNTYDMNNTGNKTTTARKPGQEDAQESVQESGVDVAKVQAKASEVLAKNQIQSPFVNAFDIAAAEGIAIKYRNFQPKDQSVSGFYFQNDKAIYLNADEPSVRQLFTVAHELGHYFLEHKPDEYGVYRRQPVTTGVKPLNEKEADCFAANLLMPEAMIQAEFSRHPFLKSMGPSFLALKFGVSSIAMSNRLKNLGYIG